VSPLTSSVGEVGLHASAFRYAAPVGDLTEHSAELVRDVEGGARLAAAVDRRTADDSAGAARYADAAWAT
jgi:hypothetical protein